MKHNHHRPITPGSAAWHERIRTLLEQEATQPEQWFYLSFADPGIFHGGCIVKARGFTGAIHRAHALKINPGGQVKGWPLGPKTPALPVDRLMSKEEMEALEGEIENS